MTKLNQLIEGKEKFFKFMKEKYPLFKNSNIFFRDLQYAIISYFELQEKKILYSEAENLTNDFLDHLVKNNEIVAVANNAWRIDFNWINETPAEIENEVK